MMVFGCVILISMDFYNFVCFLRSFSFNWVDISNTHDIDLHLEVHQNFSATQHIKFSSRCLEIWSNTAKIVWFITSNFQ